MSMTCEEMRRKNVKIDREKADDLAGTTDFSAYQSVNIYN